ncbi:MAG: ATP-binding protein [Hymenobacter sp.]
MADLIGDADPIKAATLKLPYSDERVIHFGLIPRAHRGIFVINELPDLQARIQVSLFNILQEGDIQIRGFKVRLPLDIQFVFTANPGGLHQPRQHRDAAQGPDRRADYHALPQVHRNRQAHYQAGSPHQRGAAAAW